MDRFTPDPGQVLNSNLTSLRAGEPQLMDALALVPLHTDSLAPSLTYLTLAEAHAQHQIVVTEKPHATVPTLLVINKAASPVLILDGEEIVGGRQNRVVNTTLLIPAQSTFELDGTCVEQGRWHAPTGETFAPGETLYPTLRQQKSAQIAASLVASGAPQADQSAVWGEVAAMHQRRGTRSSTQAVHDVYVEQNEMLRRAEEVLRYPAQEAVGVVALVNGQPICADIFDRAATLQLYWSNLVRSHALEAESVTSTGAPASTAQASTMALLTSAVAAPKQVFRSRGLGSDVRIATAEVLGAALVHEEAAVHVALFPSDAYRAGAASFARPSARARRLRHGSRR